MRLQRGYGGRIKDSTACACLSVLSHFSDVTVFKVLIKIIQTTDITSNEFMLHWNYSFH